MIKTKRDLFAAMQNGATIITPNNRLSNQLLQDYYHDHNSVVKNKPLCLPYQAFLHQLYNIIRHHHPYDAHPVVFSSFQQHHLWKTIITNQDQYLYNEGLLHEVQDAWTRCQYWQLDMNSKIFDYTPQTRQFQQWQYQFQRTLTELNAITQEQLVNQLLKYPASHMQKASPTQIIWLCFDDFTPQQRLLQDAFNALDCQQDYQAFTPYFREREPSVPHIGDPSSQAPRDDERAMTHISQYYAAADQQDEYQQMIMWLQDKLAAGNTRIAVVVPDLQSQYHALERLLQQHFSAEQFSLSLGKPLTNYSLVTHALLWLSLDKTTINNHQVRLLLHSPYLSGAQSELLARAQMMHHSKLLEESEIPFDKLVEELTNIAPKLAKLLKNLTDYPQKATLQTWVHEFKTRLLAMGFPGEYSLNSSSWQCFQRFMSLFDELLPLSIFHALIDAKTALSALQDLAKTTIFQIRKSTTPIQILGLLEASGCTFDSIWVTGLTDQCLPQKTKLSAFIPIDIQREQQMPHAVAERELQFAEQTLERLRLGCQSIVFSYPCLSGDMPNLPSPLLKGLPKFTPRPFATSLTTSYLQPHEEQYQIPMLPSEMTTGGTALLANQAKCPFRAFAAHRLHATTEVEASTGLNASERGQILHKIMEWLWQQIGDQQTLKALSEAALTALIDKAMDEALAPYIHPKQHSFSTLIQQVEFTRLRRLIMACLDWEKQRPPFIVEALEKTFLIHLGGLDFRVRIDRMDRLLSDKKWVIDYKTSIPSIKPWNDERPEAPQLLLYALLDESINALLFIQLKGGRVTCNGLSEESLPVKGMTGLKKHEQWSDHQQQWHQQLSNLAEEFKQGHCPPNPTRNSTCESCDFQNLCRIH